MNTPTKSSVAATITPQVSQIIKQLMTECGIIEAELARQTGLPQTTVNRLLLSETHDPRANTLIPIAKFFGVSVGQLLGQEPISANRITGTMNLTNRNAWTVIPVIQWHEAKSWRFQHAAVTAKNNTDWITTENDISPEAFALKTLAFMEPRFRRGSTVIIDPHYEFEDGNFVIVSLNNAEPTARRILKDGGDVFFRKLYGNEDPIKQQPTDTIIGTIVETRINEK